MTKLLILILAVILVSTLAESAFRRVVRSSDYEDENGGGYDEGFAGGHVHEESHSEEGHGHHDSDFNGGHGDQGGNYNGDHGHQGGGYDENYHGQQGDEYDEHPDGHYEEHHGHHGDDSGSYY